MDLAPCLIQTFTGMTLTMRDVETIFTQHQLFVELPRIWGTDMSPLKDTSTEIKLVPKVGRQCLTSRGEVLMGRFQGERGSTFPNLGRHREHESVLLSGVHKSVDSTHHGGFHIVGLGGWGGGQDMDRDGDQVLGPTVHTASHWDGLGRRNRWAQGAAWL